MTSDDYSADALWTARVGYKQLDASAPFGQRLYDRIARLVPYWRVSSDAWGLSDDSFLVGIGVLRNFGGNVLVLPVESPESEAMRQVISVMRREISLEFGTMSNVLIVFDDAVCSYDELPLPLGQIACLAWCCADASLAQHIIKDEP